MGILFERIKHNSSEKTIVEVVLANESKELAYPAAVKEHSAVRYIHTIPDLLRWKLSTNANSLMMNAVSKFIYDSSSVYFAGSIV